MNHNTKSEDLFTVKRTTEPKSNPEQSDRPSPSDQEENARQFTDMMVRANRIFMLGLNSKLKKLHLSYQKYHLLEYLSDAHEPIMKEISTMMGMTDAAVTGTIASLEKLGLIQRIPIVNDRRKIGIQITAEGREALSDIRNMIQDMIAEAMSAQDAGREGDAQNIFSELRPLFE